MSTAGRERLREALDKLRARIHEETGDDYPLLGLLVDFEEAVRAEERAALAHDRPSGSSDVAKSGERLRETFVRLSADHSVHEDGYWDLFASVLSGSSDPEADEDIRADIRQAAMGGPDFTPKEWPESDPEAVGLDVDRLANDVRHSQPVSDYWRGFNDGIDKLAARLTEAKPESPA